MLLLYVALIQMNIRASRFRWHSCSGFSAAVAVMLLVGAFSGTSVEAQVSKADSLNIAIGSVIQMPDYCADSQESKTGYDPANYTPAQKRWAILLGPAFHHIHHYCYALSAARDASDPLMRHEVRRSKFAYAIQQCMYVVERAPADFVLLPELYFRMGQFSFQRGDVAGALDYLERSRAAKVDYWPAYLEIAKVNLSFGRRQQAEVALKAGLEAVPDNHLLRDALDKLQSMKRAEQGTRRAK